MKHSQEKIEKAMVKVINAALQMKGVVLFSFNARKLTRGKH